MHAAKYYKNQTALNLFFQWLLKITISFKSQHNNKCFNHLLSSHHLPMVYHTLLRQKKSNIYNSSWICYAWLYPIQCGLFTDINPLMAILMNIKDSIIVTIMYISPHDKPCPRKCGKLLPKKRRKEKSLQKAGFESINWWMYGLIIR